MPYNEKLASRVRDSFGKRRGLEEKKMMGGLTFMLKGKMCVGVLKNDLMARIDPELHESALKRKGCREMDFTGKPMRGFVFVGPAGTATKRDLQSWLKIAIEYNKKAKASKKKARSRK